MVVDSSGYAALAPAGERCVSTPRRGFSSFVELGKSHDGNDEPRGRLRSRRDGRFCGIDAPVRHGDRPVHRGLSCQKRTSNGFEPAQGIRIPDPSTENVYRFD
jgi:hypothetical protein